VRSRYVHETIAFLSKLSLLLLAMNASASSKSSMAFQRAVLSNAFVRRGSISHALSPISLPLTRYRGSCSASATHSTASGVR
jgi:hypothetical protein